MVIDKNYLNSLSIDELRSELEYTLQIKYGILHALRDLPEFPEPFILMHLGSIAAKYPEDWEKGKELQIKYGLKVIPPKTECELGAGLWFRLIHHLIFQDH